MFRFTIRDILLLMAVLGLAVGWWQDHRTADAKLREAVGRVACLWSDEVGHTVRFSVTGIAGTHMFAVGLPDTAEPAATDNNP